MEINSSKTTLGKYKYAFMNNLFKFRSNIKYV